MTQYMQSEMGAAKIVLVICFLFLGWGCGGIHDSQELQLVQRLKQLEQQEGWRILVSDGGRDYNYYLNIGTRSLVPIHWESNVSSKSHQIGMGSFNPDGTKITFTQSLGWTEHSLVILDLNGRKHQELLKMPYMEGARWSPNGNEIAFQGRPTDTGNYNLYVYRLSDQELSLIVEKELEPGEFLFCWGPHGKSIVYQDSENSIWVIDLDTKNRARLDKGSFPTWSPNGRYVVYRAGGAGNPGYIIYDLETGRKESILVGEPAYRSLVWSPDSRYLLYSKLSRGFWDYLFALLGEEHYGELFVIDLESEVEAKLYSHASSIYPTDWGKIGKLSTSFHRYAHVL